MILAVTGGTGFVGANLVRELLRDGCGVRVLVRPGSVRRALEGCDVEGVEHGGADARAPGVERVGGNRDAAGGVDGFHHSVFHFCDAVGE